MREVLLLCLLAACRREPDIVRCQRALTTPMTQQDDLYVVSRCAPLFRQPCREALGTARKGRTVPEALAIVEQCARAYCAEMPEQELCKPSRNRAPAATRDQFGPFVAAALARTPAADPRELPVVGMAMAIELIPQQTQRLRLGVEHGQLVLALPDASWRTPDPPAPADLAPLTAALRQRMPDPTNGGVTIEGLHALSKEAQRAVEGTIQAAGYQWVTCLPDLSNCR
jgi:hypothetical protein